MSSDIEGVRNESPVDYIERNLSIEEFVKWARGSSPRSTRLRSVVGPPGIGKSTFLKLLQDRLQLDGERVLMFDLAPSKEKSLVGVLHDDLDKHAREWKVFFASDRSVLFASALDAFLRSVSETRLILLVDSFEEVSEAEREAMEAQVLIPFLFQAGGRGDERYAVIARRDEFALSDALLRWEDEIYTLEGLDAAKANEPAEQIQRRLQAIAATSGSPDDVASILEWEEEASPLKDKEAGRIFKCTGSSAEAIVERLAPHLTPNPYINLALLRRQLLRPDGELGAEDYRAVLDAYLRRAGLPETTTYGNTLIPLSGRMDKDGKISQPEYRSNAGQAAELEALMSAGIIAYSYPHDYHMEPGVFQLVQRLSPVPAAVMPPATATASS